MAKIVKALFALKPIVTNSVVRFIIGFPLVIGVQQLAEYFYENEFIVIYKTLSTLSVFIAYYFIFLPAIGGMTGRIYSFHEEKNAANLHKNPLKYAFKHRKKIVALYKLLFVVGSGYALFMLWFFN